MSHFSDDVYPEVPAVLPYVPAWADEKEVVTNYTGYGYEGSENFEHDTNASLVNESGCADQIFTAMAEHEDWQAGYDY